MKNTAMKQTLILAIFFLMMTTTYSSFSSIIHYISTHSDLSYGFEGQIVLIVNYLVYLIGLIKATNIVNYKRHFLIAAVCYTVNYALYFLQFNKDIGLVIGVIGAIVGGYGAAILWVSQGGYMTLILSKNNIQKNKSGKYLGVLNGFILSNSFLGAIFITFGLGIFGKQIYFIILTAIGTLAFLFCLFFINPLRSSSKSQHYELHEEKQTEIIENKVSSQYSCLQLKQIINFYPKMKFLIIPIFLDGITMGFLSTAISNILPQNMNDSMHLGYLLMVAGVGAIFTGFFASYLTDIIKTTSVGIIIISFTLLTTIMTFALFYFKFQTLTYALILGFFWGASFHAMQSWLFACCTKIYKGNIKSYAIVKQMHTLSFILFQIHMILTDQVFHYDICFSIIIIMCILSLISCRKLQNFQPYQNKIQQKSPEEAINQ